MLPKFDAKYPSEKILNTYNNVNSGQFDPLIDALFKDQF